MGIANEFTFGGASTSDYGLVVEGPGNYSAPTRAVEVINIPGRDGAFVLDKGYYENVPAEFNVVAKGATQSDFKDIISAFRNAIVSQRGYVRLEELYQLGEYRMARYAGGLDEDPTFHGNGAIFKVKFDCKPQRYLTDGETAVSVEDGDTLTNPTLFEAHPLLEVEGYGNINVNGRNISIANDGIGDVVVGTAEENTSGNPIVQNVDGNLFNDGDTLTIQPFNPQVRYKKKSGVTNIVLGTCTNASASMSGDYITVTLYPDPHSFVSNGNNTFTITGYAAISYEKGASQYAEHLDVTITVQYDATNKTLTYTNTRTSSEGWTAMPKKNASAEVIADSSVSILGNPTYIDCEIGEAYKYENDSLVSLNSHIDLGSKLPELSPGDNEITFDNTFTDVSIIPRWWKV